MRTLIVRKTSLRQRRWIAPDGHTKTAWLFELAIEDEDGPRRVRRSGFPDKATAKEAAKLEVERLRTAAKRTSSPISLHRLLALYGEEGNCHLRATSRRTESGDLRNLARLIPDCPLSKVNAGTVERCIRDRRKEATSTPVVRREAGLLVRAVAWATRRGLVGETDCANAKRPRLVAAATKALAPKEARALLAAARGPVRVFVALGLLAGLRKGEILALPWRAIDFERGTLAVAPHATFQTKSGRPRTLGLHRDLAGILEEWRAACGDSPWVFPAPRNPAKHRDSQSLRTAFELTAKRAGVEHATPHKLRHTHATGLALSGAGATALREALGHADLATSQRYLGATESLAATAALGLPSLLTPEPKPPAPEPVAAAIVELHPPDNEAAAES